MATLTFDTHRFIRKLKDAGVPENQAEAFSDAVRDVFNDSDLSTKRDLKELEIVLRAEITNVRAEITNVRAEMSVMKWMLGIIVAGVIALVLKAFF